MQKLSTVVLCHETTHGSHYDWLLAQPRVATAGTAVWAGRTTLHSRHWQRRKTWILHRMNPHRAYYLTYQGPVPPKDRRARGQVRRVDRGTLMPKIWTPNRIVVAVSMRFFQATVEIHLMDSQTCYRASVVTNEPLA